MRLDVVIDSDIYHFATGKNCRFVLDMMLANRPGFQPETIPGLIVYMTKLVLLAHYPLGNPFAVLTHVF